MKPLLAASLLALLAGSAPAAEKHPPAVLDNAKLFSQSAIERVGHIADALRSSWGIDLCIETAKEPPGIKPGSLKGKKKNEVGERLIRAAQDRADELGVHGLYALVALDPPSATVVGWPADLERGWATSDHKRRQLRKALERLRLPAELRDGSPGHDDEARQRRGEALVRAVEEYRKSVGDPHQPSPMGMVPALAVSGSLLAAWAFLMLARTRRWGAGRALPIYQPAMQGSLFGVPAGYWVHDRLFYAERPAFPAPPEPAPEAPPAPAEEPPHAPGENPP
jgi:hypothetical protein